MSANMVAKSGATFQAVPLSDDRDIRNDEAPRKQKPYKPAGSQPFVLVTFLCLILVCIALLQVVVSKSEAPPLPTSAASVFAKRQATTTITQAFTGFGETITGSTITWAPTTATFPSRTITYAQTTQTITGTTESDPGSTQVLVGVATVVSGITETNYYELTTIDGTPTSIFLPSATPSTAYLDTSTGPGTSATAPTAFLNPSPVSSAASTAFLDTSTIPGTSATPSTAYLNPSPSPLPGGFIALPRTNRVVSGVFSTARYYVATYLPSLFMVLLKCTAGVVFSSAKIVEPFYQLRRVGGADAKISLLADYLSSGISFASISTLSNKRPIMLLATLTFAIATIMAPIASESMSIKAIRLCVQNDGALKNCYPVWTLNMACIRALQALLALLFCVLIAFTWFYTRRRDGISFDPTSIVSVASLMRDPGFVAELRSIPPNASTKDIQKFLKGNKYALGSYSNVVGNSGWGIIKTQSTIRDSNPRHLLDRTKTPSRVSKYLQDLLLLFLSVGILAVVLAYYKDYANDSFNRFFNSDTFGSRFILSAFATLLDNRWKRLEREIRTMQPFRTLHKHRGAPAKVLTDTVASSVYSSLPISLARGNLFLGWVAFITLLGDVLIIAIAGVPFSSAEIYSAFTVSTYLSIAILALMVATSIAAFIWRRGNPVLPRDPDTILGIAMYLCASPWTEHLTKGEGEKVEDLGVDQRYWFGQGMGVDEKERWLVDRM